MKLRTEEESKKASYIKFLNRFFEFKNKSQQERHRLWALSRQTKPPRRSLEGRVANSFLKKKVLKGKYIKYLSFKGLTTSTLFVFYPRVSEDKSVSGKVLNGSGFANISKYIPRERSRNSKQYAWIRGPISTPMQSFCPSWQQSHLQRAESRGEKHVRPRVTILK